MPINLESVSFFYGDKKILKDFNLSVKNGECICLLGPSGCGKTTTLRLIAGLETPMSGVVDTHNGKISMVFQEDRLLPWATALQNVSLPLTDKDKSFAKKLLEQVGLSDSADLLPEEMSGGMCRRVAIARALAFGGDILLLDEPFNGIDADNKRYLAKLILDLFGDKTIVIITHSTEDAQLLGATIIDFNNKNQDALVN